MKRLYVAVAFLVIFSATSPTIWAESLSSPKINPYAIDYPLTRSAPYRSSSGDPYEVSFGIRRWLLPLRITQDPMYAETVTATQRWFSRFGGYGVLGQGEDVFTRQGAQLRRQYRGH